MPEQQSDGETNCVSAPASGGQNLVLNQLRSDIKDLRNQLAELQLYVRNTSLRGRLRRLAAFIAGARLHSLVHHKPRELYVPNRYRKPIPLANPQVISIATPSFNQGRYLEETIRSVLDQNYPALEYAVQDGGSTDESVAVMEKYRDRLANIESRKDNGQAQAINLGFAHATRGEIMGYLNSDDLLMPGCLNYVAAYFAANPDVDVVYGHRVIIDQHGKEVALDLAGTLGPHVDLGRLRSARDDVLAATNLGQGWRAN